MSLWSRIRQRVRSVIERFTEPTPEPPPPPPPPPREPPRGPGIGYGGEEPSRLPPGWSVVGLYHSKEKTDRIHATDDTEVTDSDIEHADAIIVWYEDAGEDGYRWIHGASGWDGLADLISRVVIIVSPPGR